MSTTTADPHPDPAAAKSFLTSLLNRQLCVHATDGRMFKGEFKCTDNERNIILSHAYEYRLPSALVAARAAKDVEGEAAAAGDGATGPATVKVNMTSRFMGLVVVPGQHITRIEIEERV